VLDVLSPMRAAVQVQIADAQWSDHHGSPSLSLSLPPLTFMRGRVWVPASRASRVEWTTELLLKHIGDAARAAPEAALTAVAEALFDGFCHMIELSAEAAAATAHARDKTLAVTAVRVSPLTVQTCLDDATKEAPLCLFVALGDGGVELSVPMIMHNGGERTVTPRALLEWLGTDVMRAKIHSDVWLNAATAPLKPAAAPRVVFTDARFPNELEQGSDMLRARGYTPVKWRVVDPHEVPPSVPQHVSATAADALPVDATIVNDKTAGLTALAAAVEAAVVSAELLATQAARRATDAAEMAAQPRECTRPPALHAPQQRAAIAM
jgi:hypothetical protein